MAKLFSVEDYLVPLDAFKPKPKIPVCIPQHPFRIEPDSARHAYLLYANRQWHLVHPGVVNGAYIPGVQKATLYIGIFSTGEVFLLPVTHSDQDKNQSWFEAWMEIVAQAEERWLKVSKNESERCFDYKMLKKRDEPDWPDRKMEQCIKVAFQRNAIDTPNHPLIQSAQDEARSARRTFDEDFEE
ncbi:MAG: hypothetical protein ACXWAT_05085 [Methylobacter sp.]